MYLLDSNILINFLNGNSQEVAWLLGGRKNEIHFCFSVISKIEILSLPSLKEQQVESIEKFLAVLQEVYLSDEVVALSAQLRRNFKLSLGDAIITATAISKKLILVSNDKTLLNKVKNIVQVMSISNT